MTWLGDFKRSKASKRTLCWNSGSLGFPIGRPSGKSQNSPRGGAVLYSCSRIDPMVSVAMPADSNMWASVLTVRVHKGQTGVSKTTSTSCLFNREAAAGPPSSRIPDRSN